MPGIELATAFNVLLHFRIECIAKTNLQNTSTGRGEHLVQRLVQWIPLRPSLRLPSFCRLFKMFIDSELASFAKQLAFDLRKTSPTAMG